MEIKLLYEKLKEKDVGNTYIFLENELKNLNNTFAMLVELKSYIKKQVATSEIWGILITVILGFITLMFETNDTFLIILWMFILIIGLIGYYYSFKLYSNNIYLLSIVESVIDNYNEKGEIKNEKKNS